MVSSEKSHVTKHLGLPQLVKIFRSQTPAHCERDYSKHDSELFIKSVSFKVFWGLTSPMAWYWSGTIFGTYYFRKSALFPNKNWHANPVRLWFLSYLGWLLWKPLFWNQCAQLHISEWMPYIYNNVLYVCDTSIHSYALARTYIIDTLIVVVLLFVVNMNTLNIFRRVGSYTEAIARHRKAGYDAGENERRAAEMANRRQELGGLPWLSLHYFYKPCDPFIVHCAYMQTCNILCAVNYYAYNSLTLVPQSTAFAYTAV